VAWLARVEEAWSNEGGMVASSTQPSMAGMLRAARSCAAAEARSERKCGKEWEKICGCSAWCLEGKDA
jgi:hypothetical protein